MERMKKKNQTYQEEDDVDIDDQWEEIDHAECLPQDDSSHTAGNVIFSNVKYTIENAILE